MSSFIQELFIEQVLTQEGDRYATNQESAMSAVLHFHSHNIVDRRQIHTETGDNLSGKLVISHTAYERFLDMKTLHYGARIVQPNRKIHNRYVWALYYSIAYRLMNDFTDQVAAKLREQFNAK